MERNMDLGTRLKRFRKQRNLTVAEIARRIPVSESTYRDWENGRAIKGEPYVRLARVFDVSLNELFGESPSEDTSSADAAAEIEAIQQLLNRLRSKIK